MKKEEIEKLKVAFRHNSNDDAYCWNEQTQRLERMSIGIITTIIDYLRGDIEGLPSPLTVLASQAASSSQPSAPADNGDPDSLATEVMKKLGSLGLQSLTELKGYKIDDNNHILLHINGRMADTGWTDLRPLSVLARIMREQEMLLPRLT